MYDRHLPDVRTAPGGYESVPKTADKPRIQHQLEQLAKVLSECHHATEALERVADRVLGPVPQDVSKSEGKPPSDTLERKMAEAIAYAEALCSRLQNAANRLNAAV